ncbi:hypothetical protein BJ980_003662 [Nocardioides daedukensis]|uniref:Uncharacterized protein n=1 Tax=Nocardioides daedukensis TaxID=634462 RepID=A0A7Y9S484_9ACTN|nr:hypothetical protein [Nocardioides daedukensis]NYG60739.1 hypothetical protein [Nocardioides daedukensis]
MGNSFKAILALCVAMPMLAYIAGALVAANGPTSDRSPITFTEPTDAASPDAETTDDAKPSESATPKTPAHGDDTATDRGEGTRTEPRVTRKATPKPAPKTQEAPKVVTPRPEPRDDDDDDRESDDREWDDDDAEEDDDD